MTQFRKIQAQTDRLEPQGLTETSIMELKLENGIYSTTDLW